MPAAIDTRRRRLKAHLPKAEAVPDAAPAIPDRRGEAGAAVFC
jgi:hypothetical protein